MNQGASTPFIGSFGLGHARSHVCGEWLNQARVGAQRAAVIGFVGEIAAARADIAQRWAETITDPARREEWLKNASSLKLSAEEQARRKLSGRKNN